MKNSNNYQGSEVAIIGMSGRFPSAGSIEEFWQNLINGREGIKNFTDQELLESGIDLSEIKDPNYVKIKAQINDVEMFDASFFGYSPKEAELIDPQQRLFLEYVWEALENAGYNQDNYNGLIGVFAGAGFSNYYVNNIILNSQFHSSLGNYQNTVSNFSDFLCTRVSYKLNLKGPSLTIQTACSTSLVAVHYACQSLLLRECDMALAGGVKVMLPRNSGYTYSEGGITSLDGHCRAFDKEAAGMVPGEGIGIVVLKRLDDALKDGDHIYAIIRGSAINNDGSLKIGYTAPSIEGQSKVVAEAQSVAGIDPETITYIETHGTGTKLGDPIEIKALTQAFNTKKRNYCAVGSVKTNVGHIDTAAGVAGLIKTALMLKYKKFVPSLHFKEPNPNIDFKNSPFFVNTDYKDWETNDLPRCAGVSSFGIGGTNVHVVLEEAPEVVSSSLGRNYKLIMLSAKTALALEKITQNLVSYIKEQPNVNIADVAYTLQVGRKPFNYRSFMVWSDSKEIIETITESQENKVHTFTTKEEIASVIFMFSGQGSQYVKMGYDLYLTEQFFRQKVDECLNIIESFYTYDIKSILFSQEVDNTKINQTEIAQPLLFIIEYSLTKLLMYWGIKPIVMIGHSIGEYVAACISGVFSLEDALKLVVMRGKLMQELPTGAMLSVALPEEHLLSLISGEISLAAVNANDSCVLSGKNDAITKITNQFKEKDIIFQQLKTSHAFHSDMMEPILGRFEEEVKKVKINTIQIPYISNITGKWITQEQVEDCKYWTKHLRQTVRFYDGILELSKLNNAVFIEVGPGKALSTLVRQAQNKDIKLKTFNLLRHPNENIADDYYFTTKLGQLWLNNIEINWNAYYSEEKRNRVPLPTYPFERQRYWIDIKQNESKAKSLLNSSSKKEDMADWFYIPSWEQSVSNEQVNIQSSEGNQYLVFTENNKLCNLLVSRLEHEGHHVITVHIGTGFLEKNDKEFQINPTVEEDYFKLFQSLKTLDTFPNRIMHLWNIDDFETDNLLNNIDKIQERGFYSLINICKSLGQNNVKKQINLEVITGNMHSITGEEKINPLKSTLLSAIKIIPLEYLNVKCQNIDISISSVNNAQEEKVIDQILSELKSEKINNTIVGFRGNYRWIINYKAVRLEKLTSATPFRQEGVYLITGGLGGIGLTIAEHLAKNYKAKLILVNRSSFPSSSEWDKYLKENSAEDKTSLRILKIKELETFGGKIMICSADVSNYQKMSEVIKTAKNTFGQINGLFHTAGVVDHAGKIQIQTKNKTEEILLPKVKGTLVLDKILKNNDLDFFINFSSLSVQAYDANYQRIGYAAANEFLDAFSYFKIHDGDKNIKTINWPTWVEVGMAYNNKKTKIKWKNIITPSEGIEVLYRSLNIKSCQVIVSKYNLNLIVDSKQEIEISNIETSESTNDSQKSQYMPRPELDTQYIAPENEIENKLVKIFENFFGYSHIGTNDNFFDLGGDSLKAINLLSKLQKEFEVKISLQEFFNYSTVINLSKLIEKNTKTNMYNFIEKANKQEYYPVSSAQKRLYILHQFDENNVVYNMPIIYLLHGEINYEKLEQSFNLIIKKHEAFRTSFTYIDGAPVQKIEENISFKIEHAQIKENEINTIIQKSVKPFDLGKAPLLRVKLFKIEENKHVLFIDMHHIIGDGTSISIFMKDIKKAYDGEKLNELSIQYKDFAMWEQSKISSELYKTQEQYWIKTLNDSIPVLNLPIDYKRPPIQSFEGALIRFELPEDVFRKIQKLCLKYNVTQYMLLLSIYNILLSKYSGTEDILVGTVNAGRDHEDMQEIIGIFINTLVIRSKPIGSKKFIDYLSETKMRVLGAFENQRYPFEELIEKLDVPRNMDRNPLFDTLFLFQNFERGKLQIGQIEVERYVLKQDVSKFDITFYMFENKNNIFCYGMEYCTKLFKEETIIRMCNNFANIITQVINNPEQQISEIEIITPNEKQQVIFEYNITKVDYPNTTVHELFEEQVKKIPKSTAIVCQEEEINYETLNLKSNQLASYLIERGVHNEDVVALMVNRSVEMMIGLLGILKSGCAYLPIDPDYPQERIKYMLENSKAKILITEDTLLERIANVDIEIINVKDNKIYEKEGDNLNKVLSSNLAYVIYTSGSTGKPKGIMIEHRNIVNFITGVTAKIPFDCGKTLLSLTTISFDIFVLESFLALSKGLRVIIGDREEQNDLKKMANLVKKYKTEMLQLTPSRLKLILSSGESNEIFSNVKELMIGGEAFPVNLLKELKETYKGRIFNMYGPTETTVWSTIKELTDEVEITLGEPISNTQIYILDKKNNVQPIGVAGELCIGGEGVARGYWELDELTREKFIANRFLNEGRIYKTGDLARRTSNGSLEFLGRLDFQVKIRGYRIELGEIQELLKQHPDITETIVLAKKNKNDESELYAYILLRKEIVVGDLRNYLSSKLPEYMIPSYFIKIEEIPLTPNKKIDVNALEHIGRQIETGTSYIAPQNEIEIKITELWKTILKVNKISVNDKFFELGGNSLNIIHVSNKLKEIFNATIPVVKLFEYTSIRSLANYIQSLQTNVQSNINDYKELDEFHDSVTDLLQNFNDNEAQ